MSLVRTDPHLWYMLVSLVCHVDLDSLWMVQWEDCRTFETGSHTGISIWRSVMCSVARLSRMPVLLDTGCLKSFGELGRECVLDLNAGRHIPQFGRLNVVWRRFLQNRRFHLVVWWWCRLLRSRRCAIAR